MAKQKKSPVWVVIALIIAVVSWYMKRQEAEKNGFPAEATSEQRVKGASSASPRSGSSSSARPAASKIDVSKGGYEVLENCRLSDSHRNDGDSFFVKYSGSETEFRLYFTDTPESKYKEYRNGQSNGKRLDQQGDYYGGLDRKATAQVGIAAKNYVKKILGKHDFRVATRWEDVYGPDRKYAFVLVNVDGKERYLHELLVSNGLARIHTKPADLPDGTSASKQKRKLYKMESEAKQAGRGGWGM